MIKDLGSSLANICGFGKYFNCSRSLCFPLYQWICFSNAVTGPGWISYKKVKKRLSLEIGTLSLKSGDPGEISEHVLLRTKTDSLSMWFLEQPLRTVLSHSTAFTQLSGYGASVNSIPMLPTWIWMKILLSFPCFKSLHIQKEWGFLCMHLHRDGKWATGELKWFPFTPQLNLDISRHDPGFLTDSEILCDFCLSTCFN